MFLSPKQLESAEEKVIRLLKDGNIDKQPCYKPAEVQKLLNISYPMFLSMVEIWEPMEVKQRNKKGLESFWVGRHRRIPHYGLVEWMYFNNGYR